MSLTLEELKEKLADQLDEETLLDLLEINSHDIVERFEDKIEIKFDKIKFEFEDAELE